MRSPRGPFPAPAELGSPLPAAQVLRGIAQRLHPRNRGSVSPAPHREPQEPRGPILIFLKPKRPEKNNRPRRVWALPSFLVAFRTQRPRTQAPCPVSVSARGLLHTRRPCSLLRFTDATFLGIPGKICKSRKLGYLVFLPI